LATARGDLRGDWHKAKLALSGLIISAPRFIEAFSYSML
jgi:hypothetical protein